MVCTWLLPWLDIENGGERQRLGVKFVMTHFFYLFNAKAYMTGKSAFANLEQCKGLLFIAAVIFLGQVALTEMPGLQGFFNIAPGGVRVADWLIITAGSFLVLGVREVWRLFKK